MKDKSLFNTGASSSTYPELKSKRKKLAETAGKDHTFFNLCVLFYCSLEHPTEQPLAAFLKSGHLEHHQASFDRAAEGLSLVRLMREVTSRHVEPVSVVKSGLPHDPATS